jgi:hypothetical protein
MACVGSLPELAEHLIDLANAAGGHDNITCIVADFDGEALEPPEEGVLPFYQQYPLPRGDERRQTGKGPALPHAVKKSIVPRAESKKRSAKRGEAAYSPSDAPSVSWATAASVLALLALAAVITIVSVGRRSTSTAAAPPPPPVYADAQIPVEVKVRAALDEGELYVNGRSYGPLQVDEAVLLRLLPGAYHFEAREVDGTQIGKDVTVEPGTPREVILIPPSD